MFEITKTENGIVLRGRWDAAQSDLARQTFETIDRTSAVDFASLDYISSAGLGILLSTQKRLAASGHELLLNNMNGHIREIFDLCGFDQLFRIELT